jgi:gamma-glutamyltranspeptidase/glutathione hydrolase
MFLY